jgi:aspartate carbamoyltransferase regulatory subunit
MRENQDIIAQIENGTVIDHIPAGHGFRVYHILGLDKYVPGRIVSFADGVISPRLVEKKVPEPRKAIIKVEGMYLSDDQLNLVSLVASGAVVSRIKDWEVVLPQINVQIPERLEGLVLCPNLGCVSNDREEYLPSLIHYFNQRFSCHYCNSDFSMDELRIKGFSYSICP